MVVQCCVCKKIRENDSWVEATFYFDPEEASHGYCPACSAQALAEIAEWLEKERQQQVCQAA